MTTDGYVVSPLFFPGGDIGSLAVHGTINDVAMAGARPLYLSASFILEEGFPLADLKRIADSMGAASPRGRRAGRHRRHQGGGARQGRRRLHLHHRHRRRARQASICPADKARPGDVVFLSGTIGDHGVAVMSKRENLSFETDHRFRFRRAARAGRRDGGRRWPRPARRCATRRAAGWRPR